MRVLEILAPTVTPFYRPKPASDAPYPGAVRAAIIASGVVLTWAAVGFAFARLIP